jgi:hypothetical protein
MRVSRISGRNAGSSCSLMASILTVQEIVSQAKQIRVVLESVQHVYEPDIGEARSCIS